MGLAKKQTVAQRAAVAREQVCDDICAHLDALSDAQLQALAIEAGCHWGTLYAWKSGATLAPRISTLGAVAAALGYAITLTPLVPQRGRKAKLTRVK